MTEAVHVHILSAERGVFHQELPPAPPSGNVTATLRTYFVPDAEGKPVNILASVPGRKRRSVLVTYGAKVVVSSESGEGMATAGTAGGTGVVLPNTSLSGSGIELSTNDDLWATSTDGTPQAIGVISEFTS